MSRRRGCCRACQTTYCCAQSIKVHSVRSNYVYTNIFIFPKKGCQYRKFSAGSDLKRISNKKFSHQKCKKMSMVKNKFEILSPKCYKGTSNLLIVIVLKLIWFEYDRQMDKLHKPCTFKLLTHWNALMFGTIVTRLNIFEILNKSERVRKMFRLKYDEWVFHYYLEFTIQS